MLVGIPYSIQEIIRSREQGHKIQLVGLNSDDENTDTDENGGIFEYCDGGIFGYCDGSDSYTARCRGGTDPVGSFTFMFVELEHRLSSSENKYLLCEHCTDEIKRIMNARTEIVGRFGITSKEIPVAERHHNYVTRSIFLWIVHLITSTVEVIRDYHLLKRDTIYD